MDIARSLNEDQIAAVTHGEGPQLVLAGAGSGKTRVITYRIGWLVESRDVDPARVVAVTFTNKAAAEMRHRVEALLARSPLEGFVGTFHRFGLLMLRRYAEHAGLEPGFMVFDDADQIALVKRALEEEGMAEGAYPPRAMLARISDAKSKLLDPESYAASTSGFFEERLARVYRRYQHLLKRASAVDFDDLIGLPVRLLSGDHEVAARIKGRIRHLLVDEFQDTNHAQLRLVRELVGPAGNLTAVGDEDQGIYRWRGADLDNVLHFERSFPGAVVRKLERNYRSTQTILDAAGELVAHNRKRRGKRLWTDAGRGEPIELYRARDEMDEALWVVGRAADLARTGTPWREIAILVRTNAQTRALEEELLRTRTPYVLIGGTRFYERAEVKDVVAYLRAIWDPRDELSMARIVNQPPRGIGKATQRLLEEEAERAGLPVWDLLALDRLDSLPGKSARALRSFRDLLVELHADLDRLPAFELLEKLLDRSGLLLLYDRPDAESEARRENLQEFLSAAQELLSRDPARRELPARETLPDLLDHIALVADLDGWKVERGLAVLTLHSAKGLEFRAVFVTGLEGGVLPHYNAQDRPDDIEEERRLLYVGMTRARERLHLSACRRRRVAGRFQDQEPSPFLDEIPGLLVEGQGGPSHRYDHERTRGVAAFFGRREDRTCSQEERPLAKGRRVRHPQLGEGVVLSVEGQGEAMKLTVFFERDGKRKLIAKYANLELVR
ncbi:MAG TPA: UvrD-helicase domain-containing protein [Thermoanaerobaculia bacterium]|nr:UvrD-helicase domain-containing protein [Thermoanaerobaculia bacterium]